MQIYYVYHIFFSLREQWKYILKKKNKCITSGQTFDDEGPSTGTGTLINAQGTKMCAIDLFSLYVLFSHFRPHDDTPRELFLSDFILSIYICMYILWKAKRQIPWRTSHGLNWEKEVIRSIGISWTVKRQALLEPRGLAHNYSVFKGNAICNLSSASRKIGIDFNGA